MLNKLVILAIALASVNGASVRESVVLQADVGVKMACSTVGTTGCPSGTYIQQGCYNCFVDYSNSLGSLTCNCPATTTLQNAFACSGAIQNVNGELACVLPKSSTTNGYLTILPSGLPACTGCSISSNSDIANNLNCQLCTNQNGNQFFGLSLFNPYNCQYGVTFSNGALFCASNPNPPTPSPQNVAPQCIGKYWPTVSQNGEYAPWKSCNTGQSNWYFTSKVGCEQQNFCCWNAQTNNCNTPVNVPNCPTLNNANACANQGKGFCQWSPVTDCSSGTPPQKFCNQGGICSRICPGNENQLCPYTN